MRKITPLLLVLALAMTVKVSAQETCTADATKLYYTTNAGWTASEWYPILNIDAELLTTEVTKLAAHSGANGTATSSTFSSGVFKTPVYNVDEAMNPVETSVLWPVKYYMACLTSTFYNSSYTKVNELGSNPSGSGTNDAPCYFNNNSVIQSPIWNKKGFIELSRQASETANTPPSRHGYILLEDLPQVERIQWSFSSTGWKRGFKLDIKHNDGEWQPLRWEPSDIAASLTSFSEQGYAFEEMINKQEDPSSKISLRWTIWDGDTIHENVTKTDGSKYSTTHTPYASKQVVRVHQIKVFSGIVPTVAPNNVTTATESFVNIYRSGNSIRLTETVDVELYTLGGKVIFAGNTDRIELAGMSQGVYIVKARALDGRVQNQKIIY